MQINVSYDDSVADAPSGFKIAVQAAVQYFEQTFSAPITLNISFGWGEAGGQALDSDTLGSSLTQYINTSFSISAHSLLLNATSPAIVAAIEALPQQSPVETNSAILPYAEARVLGQAPAVAGIFDGYIGLNASATYTFDPGNRAVAGAYDAIGIIEHEISEVMGRQSFQGGPTPNGAASGYSPLDFFRYLAPGEPTYAQGASYFSLNGNQMLLPFNDPANGGDGGDWSTAVTGDASEAFAELGTQMSMSAVDLRLLELLGYNLSPTAPTPNGSPIVPITFSQDFQVASGQTVNFDGPLAFVMQGSGLAQSLNNAGTIVDTGVRSQTDVVGLSYAIGQSGNANSTFVNTASGVLTVRATADAADAVGVFEGPSVQNAGHISVVSAKADAWGIWGGSYTSTTTGSLDVQSANSAIGVDFLAQGGNFSNAGTINVTGVHAIGVEGMTTFDNSGSLIVTGVGTGATSVGVFVAAPYGSNFTNSGTIQADQAFVVDPVFRGGAFPDITITNSGTIHGTITFANAFNTIHNTGLIDGAIYYGDGSALYDGSGGTQSGGIYLGHGNNTVALGNDGEAVFGGGGSDHVTGGSGNDFIEIGRGTNVIDGGGGFNTLSVADSDMAVTVDLGAGTVSGAGTSTVSHIQQVIGSGFNDTLIAGASAATLIAGAGHSTLKGGAGADTLVAGAGGGTMTGNGSSDTFIYSAGDHQLVVTDFGTGGDVLHVDGYSSALSIQQQGSDTLITLSATDSILLKNVLTSSLNSGNLFYSPTPYAGPNVPASAPVFGTVPIKFTYNLTILAGEAINEINQHVGFIDVGGGSPGPDSLFHSLDNFGSINISTSVGDVSGFTSDVSAVGFLGGVAVTNEVGATFFVTDTDPLGVAKGFETGNMPPFMNHGTFNVTAVGDAYGIETSDASLGFTNSATGRFTVSSSAGDAYGIYDHNGTTAPGGVVNEGDLEVTAAQSAYGIKSDRFEFSSIVNNGDITVTGADSYGISVRAINVAIPSTIVNTGTITAQTAIESTAFISPAATALIVTNSGTINGAINIGDGDDEIHNTGSINGSIRFGNGANLYDGSGGTQSGGIYLGHGNNTVALGNDGEAVFGGGGSDHVTGGSGNDFIEIGRGTNVIDGGGGFNTLSVADSDMAVTVDLGAGTVSGAGTSTVSHIQQVIGSGFNDTLIAGASAATLIAGAGHSTLKGGAGADTLVAGAGGGTMTGNGSSDTFIYSAGDHQLVVTDFGTGGDVLHVDGYSSALSIQQQGSDTLITLSATDSILLKNVLTSSLNSGNLFYSPTPYAGPNVPASAPVFFSSGTPFAFDYALKIFQGEVLNIVAHTGDLNTNVNWGLQDQATGVAAQHNAGVRGSPFDNAGTISITSNDPNLIGLIQQGGDNTNYTNEAGATFSVSDPVASATGMVFLPYYITLTNGGNFSVTAAGKSTGILLSGINFTLANDAAGTISVTSTTGEAIGIGGVGNSGGTDVTNNGTLVVHGVTEAYGIQELRQDGSGFYQGSITNNGTITATASGPEAVSFGIDISGSYNVSRISHIANSGTITADVAIANEDSGDGYTPLEIANSGNINGLVYLGGSDTKLTNTGTINGDIYFSHVTKEISSPELFGISKPTLINSGTVNGDVILDGTNAFVTDTGHIYGDILLTDGDDSIDLRGGALSGKISITPTYSGPSVHDVVYTGAAGGLIDIHAGNSNLSVNVIATAGSNTVVKYDIDSHLASLAHNTDGSWAVYAGVDGTETLTNVKSLTFTDVTISLTDEHPGAQTINGGSGNDTINGGIGDDIIRPGAGTDVVHGYGSNDFINFAAALTAADVIDGGAGTDTVYLAGDYASIPLVFAATTMTNTERLTLAAGFNYNLTLNDANVAAGQVLTVDASGLGAANYLTFDGTRETNGSFYVLGGAGNDAIATGAGADSINGGDGDDIIRPGLGNDIVHGGNGNDFINFAAGLNSADAVDGGTGIDTLYLAGDYFTVPLVFAAATMTNIEQLTLAAGFSYNLTLNDANVASGQTLTVDASSLGAGNSLAFDGTHETNGAFLITGGAGNDTVNGSAKNDTINGGAGDDIIRPGSGNDIVHGGYGNDFINFAAALTVADAVDGGAGTDTLYLAGDYSTIPLVFAATTMINIEHLTLASGFNYNLTLGDANLASGQALAVDASSLGAGNFLAFDGTHETNGAFVINGGAGNDTINGGAKNDIIDGGAGDDVIRPGTGNDTVHGGGGNDFVNFGSAFTPSDVFDGGAGTDTLYLAGDYASTPLSFGATSLINVERITLSANFSYNLTTNDGNIAAGQTLTVDASALGANDRLVFDGSAETDGHFAIKSGLGADVVSGGALSDTFTYGLVAQSTGSHFDTIGHFDFNLDKFDLPGNVSGVDAAIASGALNASTFDTDLASNLGGAQLLAHHALLFTPNAGTYAGNAFLVVDANGVAGYQAGQDFVFALDNPVHLGSLSTTDFI